MNKDQLAEMQTVPDYRFGRLVKGDSYAYARGLTINPSHLPGALDAMLKDGWRLLSLFGQTDSENVGFIFERGAAEAKPVGFDGAVDILVTGLAKANSECFQLQQQVGELLQSINILVDSNNELRRQLKDLNGTEIETTSASEDIQIYGGVEF